MISRLARRGHTFAFVALVLVLGVGGMAYASVPDGSGVIHGCYATKDGSLRVIDSDAGAACSTKETSLTWNQQGPQGPQGDPGPPGTVSLASLDGSACVRSSGGTGNLLVTVGDDDLISLTCLAPSTAFRFTDLDLRDPHIFVNLFGVTDITDLPFGGVSFNGQLEEALTTDADGDGFLDLSPVNLFRPLDQAATTTAAEIETGARCAAPPAISCVPGGAAVATTATNRAVGLCLGPIAGTTTDHYALDVALATAPCFSTSSATLTIDLLGIPLTLNDARIGATYVGDPATGEMNGLLVGFLSEAAADSTILPDSFPIAGGEPLSLVLPGGTDNGASHSDMDEHNGVPGWWIYLNFAATRTDWTN